MSQNMRAECCAPSLWAHGRIWNVEASGRATVSASETQAIPGRVCWFRRGTQDRCFCLSETSGSDRCGGSRVCRPGLSLVRQCGIARRNPSSLETGKAKNSAVDMVFLKKETKGGRLILIWNMEDDSIDWIAGLKALYGRFEDGTFPQFATMKWRKVWETEAAKELFLVLPEVWDAHVPQVREAFCNLVFFFC